VIEAHSLQAMNGKTCYTKLSIERSYSSAGTPTENGKIERLFSTLKTELEMRQIKQIV